MRLGGVALKFGAFTGISLVLLALLFNTMANDVDGGTRPYAAVFTNVSGLRAGDDVRVAGVKVGRVQTIEVDGRQARVGFVLSEDQPLLSSTSIVMRYQNLLGQRYLSLVQGPDRGDPLPAGSTVPVERTSPGFDLTALLNGFRPLFEVLEPADVNELSRTVVQVLQGEGGTVEQLLRQTTELTNFLADRDALFAEVADNLTPVLESLSGQGVELEATVVELRRLTEGLARDRAEFGRAVEGIGRLVDTTSEVLQEARAPLARDVRSLRRVARMYAAERQVVGDAIIAFGDLLGVIGRVTSYRSAANIYLCDLGLEVDGQALSFGTVSQDYSEVCR